VRRRSIDDVMLEARRDLDRVAPTHLAAEMAGGALVVDIRPAEQRHRDGEMAGAVVVGRNELEWRLDPASPDRIPEATDHDRRIIVVCDEGYASSLAAASLRQLGLRRATDLDGGFQAWRTFVDTSRSEETTAHWEQIYGTRAPTELSWFEAEPAMSLEMIAAAKKVEPHTAIIDVGGGASTLVDVLVARGYRDLTVLDVSHAALDIARSRLGEDATRVRWIAHDVLTWRPPRRYGLWHDRAVFHFLVTPDQRAAYLAGLHAALEPGGSVIVATFADDGPEMCSGLPTARYAPGDLAAVFGSDLDVLTIRREEHFTPAGVMQPFTWLLLQAHA
jgi:rhodanese-related sulfurtransferase/SAM-dependent methyltransferase